MTSTFPVPFLSKPKSGSAGGPPAPAPACSAHQPMTHCGRAVKGNSITPTNSLKPKNIFHGVEHFLSVVFQVKSSDFLFQQKQHLAVSSGTWVPGGSRDACGFLSLLF